jgi:hypothetical protein
VSLEGSIDSQAEKFRAISAAVDYFTKRPAPIDRTTTMNLIWLIKRLGSYVHSYGTVGINEIEQARKLQEFVNALDNLKED